MRTNIQKWQNKVYVVWKCRLMQWKLLCCTVFWISQIHVWCPVYPLISNFFLLSFYYLILMLYSVLDFPHSCMMSHVSIDIQLFFQHRESWHKQRKGSFMIMIMVPHAFVELAEHTDSQHVSEFLRVHNGSFRNLQSLLQSLPVLTICYEYDKQGVPGRR